MKLVLFLFILGVADYGVLPTKHFFKMLRVHQSVHIVASLQVASLPLPRSLFGGLRS